ncbi:hypothetical protein ABZ926_02915 [Streptomyces litmocidini]|nr:hypothetical protein [Streptomyces sp. PanSC19]
MPRSSWTARWSPPATTRCWKVLRDCRLKGDGEHHAMLAIAHP